MDRSRDNDISTGICLIIYLIGCLLTGTYYYNHRAESYYAGIVESPFVGIAWPVYWPVRLCLVLTR